MVGFEPCSTKEFDPRGLVARRLDLAAASCVPIKCSVLNFALLSVAVFCWADESAEACWGRRAHAPYFGRVLACVRVSRNLSFSRVT